MSQKDVSPPAETAAPIDSLGDYELHIAWEGFASIRQRSSGEIMHSRTAPMEEARKLYVEQSRLAERLASADEKTPLVLWDVGLGAAANAMAAIQCYRAQSGNAGLRPLQIISFENDLDSLRLAVRHPDRFPYLNDEAPEGLLKNGYWRAPSDEQLDWILVQGDFTKTMTGAPGPPDLVFFDMFSPRCSPEAWSLETFERLAATCALHATELFTYTRSTANRAGFLVAGFHVARGRPFGKKEETTIALSAAAAKRAAKIDFLDHEWLAKWQRSAGKFPIGVSDDKRGEFTRRLLSHPQFR